MDKTYDPLFTPFYIDNVKIKNRIGMAAMRIDGHVSSHDDCITQRVVDYYIARAKGGVGLIVTTATEVMDDYESIKRGMTPHITNPIRFVDKNSELTERIHSYGTKIFLQVTFGYGRGSDPLTLHKQPVAPSAIPNYWDPSVICRELSTEEVEGMVKAMGKAAHIAKLAGYDGIEVHAAHEGFLIDQFMIAEFNHRTDKYGGSFENRMRLPLEIVDEIKRQAGPDFPVILRYSVKSNMNGWNTSPLPGEEYQEMGRDIEEALSIAQILEKAGYSAFDADATGQDAQFWAHPPIYQRHGFNLSYLRHLKSAVHVPVLIAGRLDIPELAAHCIRNNIGDAVMIGKGLLADEAWVNKVKSDRIDEIRPCIGCHDACLVRGAVYKPMCCSVNPRCLREIEYDLSHTAKPKNVIVVGGGVAGMEAARAASYCGHQVTLYEKSGDLGGHLIASARSRYKKDQLRFLNWYRNVVEKSGVTIKLNTVFKKEILDTLHPDVLILATGSQEKSLEIPGLEHIASGTASEFLNGNKKAGDNIVILGSGFIGCETALAFASQGKNVTIVSKDKEYLHNVETTRARKMMLTQLLGKYKVTMVFNSEIESIEAGSIHLTTDQKPKTIEADTLIFAIGLQSEQSLYEELERDYADIYLVGDANNIGGIQGAIWDSYEIARSL